jgi:sarcosine oxidase
VDNSPDVIVIGLGVHGAAVTCELARRGVRVLGIDAREPPHAAGSSHGRSRIIREAYYEHPLYVPLVQRAAELWQDMEELTGTLLYRQTGALHAGPEEGTLVQGALASVRTHDLEHELLDAHEIRRRFPALHAADAMVGLLEPRAGMLLAEACVRTMLELARGYGATIRTGASVSSWHVADGHVIVEVGSGVLRAGQAVFAAGPWLNTLLACERDAAPFALPLTIERQTSHWYSPPPDTHVFNAASCPITLLEYDTGRYFYSLPHLRHGVKAGIHHEGEPFEPVIADRSVREEDMRKVGSVLTEWMPALGTDPIESMVCLYTNTPDAHFIADRHPAHDEVMLLSACSGHGFKFAPALAEAVVDMLLDGESVWDLAPFSVARFSQDAGTVSHG